MKTNITVRRSANLAVEDSGDIVCCVQLESDQDVLLTDLDALCHQVRAAVCACQRAICGESDRNAPEHGDSHLAVPSSTPIGNLRSSADQQKGARASDKQLVYLRQLARLVPAVGLRRLDELAQNVCGKTTVVLSTAEASRLIDSLKAVKAGELDLQEILPGAPSA